MSNAFLHETKEYEFERSSGRGLIVRRGQEFKIIILLSRAFKQNKERIFLQFAAKGINIYFF